MTPVRLRYLNGSANGSRQRMEGAMPAVTPPRPAAPQVLGPCPDDVSYEDWIAYCVAQAPPLPPEVIERLARLLGPLVPPLRMDECPKGGSHNYSGHIRTCSKCNTFEVVRRR